MPGFPYHRELHEGENQVEVIMGNNKGFKESCLPQSVMGTHSRAFRRIIISFVLYFRLFLVAAYKGVGGSKCRAGRRGGKESR